MTSQDIEYISRLNNVHYVYRYFMHQITECEIKAKQWYKSCFLYFEKKKETKSILWREFMQRKILLFYHSVSFTVFFIEKD